MSTLSVPHGRLLSSVGIILGLLIFSAPHANAAGDYTTVTHYPYTLEAKGDNATATTQIPIPSGLTPIKFMGTVHTDGTASGSVAVTAGSDTTRIDAKTGGEVSIDVVNAPTNGYLSITVANYYAPEGQNCTINSITTQTLDAMTVIYKGNVAAPTTVANFFTPDVTAVSVVTPDSMAKDAAGSIAVLQMFATLGKIYSSNVPITFGSTPSASGETARIVVMKPSTDPEVTTTIGITNGTPTLTMTGTPNKLVPAALALATDSMPLASAETVTALQATSKFSPRRIVTLSSYGVGGITLQGLGTVTSDIGVDQVMFAPPVASYTFHIEGINTPVPTTTQARVSLLWNNTLIASSELGSSDTWELDASIPSPSRTGQLRIALEAADVKGNCSARGLDVRADVNMTKSSITGAAGQGIPPGFARFPQVMYPTIPVVFGTSLATMERLDSGAQLLLALARANPTVLTVVGEDLTKVVNQRLPAVVIGASTDDANKLMAPLRMYPARTVDSAGENFLVSVDGPYAALEAYESDGRNLLVLAHTDGGEKIANSLMHSINEFTYGWSNMESELFIGTGGKNEPFFLSIASLVPQTVVTEEFRSVPFWLIPLGIVLLIALIVRAVYMRMRKKRFAAYASVFTDVTSETSDTVPPDED